MTTDRVISSSFQDGILTIKWRKIGEFNYRKLHNIWVHNESGRFVGEKTADFLEDQYLKTQNQ